ncbi:hypothetical protein KXS11_14485 [Plantibacter flavus]|uniref:hypothetical protein n=1 Tax=Plantibacter flavus TaxID=150123 RepID=UPI003F180EF7
MTLTAPTRRRAAIDRAVRPPTSRPTPLGSPATWAERRLRDTQITGTTIFVLSSLLALAWVAAGQPGLPHYFANDEQTIIAVATGGFTDADDSFQRIAGFYRALGLADNRLLAPLLGLGSYLAVLAMSISGRFSATARWGDWAIIVSCVALGAIYQGAYTKDLFTLAVVAVILLRRSRGFVSEVLPVVAMLVYAANFRSYWFVVAVAYVVLRLTLSLRRGWIVTLAMILMIYAALAVVFPAALGVDLDHYRLSVNEFRSTEGVNTLIERFLDGSGPVFGFINSLLIFASFLVPLPLMLKGGALYLIVAVLLIAMWASVVVTVSVVRRRQAPGTAALTPFQNRLLAAVMALLLVQSIFEPDYGSFLRHLTPMLPVVVCLILSLRRTASELLPMRRSADELPPR